MNAKERKALADYLRSLADEMGLRDWHFTIHHTSEDLEPNVEHVNDQDEKTKAWGEMMPVIGQRHAHIRLDPALRGEDREFVRMVVIHELAHCHFVKMRELVRVGLLPHLGQQAYALFNHSFDLEWESTIDAFTRALARKLPLIRWP